eukprot:scaffold9129_cov150-Amphora_coffeaeformis.AAC.2
MLAPSRLGWGRSILAALCALLVTDCLACTGETWSYLRRVKGPCYALQHPTTWQQTAAASEISFRNQTDWMHCECMRFLGNSRRPTRDLSVRRNKAQNRSK